MLEAERTAVFEARHIDYSVRTEAEPDLCLHLLAACHPCPSTKGYSKGIIMYNVGWKEISCVSDLRAFAAYQAPGVGVGA